MLLSEYFILLSARLRLISNTRSLSPSIVPSQTQTRRVWTDKASGPFVPSRTVIVRQWYGSRC